MPSLNLQSRGNLERFCLFLDEGRITTKNILFILIFQNKEHILFILNFQNKEHFLIVKIPLNPSSLF